MINKKRLRKSLIIISLIAIIIFATIQIRKTLARYETTSTAGADVDVAFWVVDNDFKSETIVINNIYPSEKSFPYTFSVSNFSDTKSAETDLEYDILLTTTTNLPLSYEIVKVTTNGETETETPFTEVIEDLYQNTENTVYKEIKLEAAKNGLTMEHETDTTHKFRIKVTFPEEYSTNSEYADLMESIKLDITARQVIEE